MMRRGVILVVVAAMLAGCGKKSPAPSVDELREAAIHGCVGDFKTELTILSKSHPELVGVGQFDHSYLGFTFVNDNVRPRIRIALSVEDGLLPEMRSVPVGVEEVPGEHIVCALQLECESQPELETAIRTLYKQFKAKVAKALDERPSNKSAEGDAEDRAP